MQVLTIIPAVFDYFDSIRESAFRSAEIAQSQGITVEPFTLQLGKPSRATQRSVAEAAVTGKGFSLSETISLRSLEDALQEAQIVHLHAPFLGFGAEILAFKKKFPGRKLVITWYGSLPYRNLFNLFIMGYNGYYLPRLLKLADAVVQPVEATQFQQLTGKMIQEVQTLTNAPGGVQLSMYQDQTTPLFTYYLELLLQQSIF